MSRTTLATEPGFGVSSNDIGMQLSQATANYNTDHAKRRGGKAASPRQGARGTKPSGEHGIFSFPLLSHFSLSLHRSSASVRCSIQQASDNGLGERGQRNSLS